MKSSRSDNGYHVNWLRRWSCSHFASPLCFVKNTLSKPWTSTKAGALKGAKQAEEPWKGCLVTVMILTHGPDRRAIQTIGRNLKEWAGTGSGTMNKKVHLLLSFQSMVTQDWCSLHCYPHKAAPCWLSQLITPANSWRSAELQMSQISTLYFRGVRVRRKVEQHNIPAPVGCWNDVGRRLRRFIKLSLSRSQWKQVFKWNPTKTGKEPEHCAHLQPPKASVFTTCHCSG